MGTMTQHLYYQTSGSRTTPSGVISPMSPEWNLNTAARYGPLKQRKGSTVQGPVPAVFVEVCCLVGSMEKKHDAKTHKKKHIQTHQNTTFDQHVTCWSTFETHIRKIGKTKAIFSSALIAKLLSALAACSSQNRWNYLTAGSFTKYYPQHSPKLFSAPFPSSCCKQALFNHFFCVYLSVLSVCVLSLSRCFLQLPIPVPPLIQISPRPQQAEPSECTYQEASSATGILLNPTAMNYPSIAHFGARPSKHHPSDLSSAQNLSLVGL